MRINYKKMFAGLILISLCALTWCWMLGAFAVPIEMSDHVNGYYKGWANPGVLGMPAFISVVAGIVGSTTLLLSLESKKDRRKCE